MEKIKILNLYIDNLSTLELLKSFDKGILFTPNSDHLFKLQTDQDFFEIYNHATYKVCDSQVLFYLSKLLGNPLKEKISGSDFFPRFYEYHKNNEDIKIFLLGAAEGVAEKAKHNINQKVRRTMVVGCYSPPLGFEQNQDECSKIIKIINQSEATVLAVGLGAPKQEKFLFKYKDKFTKIKIFLAIGATIDFEAGYVKRAPKWMSQMALEWLYRLCQEPKRLWKRYLIDDLLVIWLIFKQKMNWYIPPF